jgi:LacI family transcriptional regulator
MATIGDVARHAGVGIATVSRVMNHHPSVSPDTRRRVQSAVEELGYEPSRTAQALSRRRSYTIGLVAPFLTRPSVVERLRGVIAALGETEFDLVLWTVETPVQRKRRMGGLVQRDRLDGAMIVSLTLDAVEASKVKAVELPSVTVDAYNYAMPSLVIDDLEGGRLATQHLVDLGHRRIAYVGDVIDDRFGFTAPARRFDGYQAALAAAGVEVRPDWVLLGDHDRKVASADAAALLGRPDRPTAVFCFSDTQAAGVLDAARACGLRVPEDLSVVGFDDIELASSLGLTTVRQPLFESGFRGAEMLLRAVQGELLEPNVEHLDLSIIERSTTASPS